MSLYRRGSTWWLELSANGRRIRESSGTADKKAAQEYHEKRKGEIWRQAKLGERPPVSWGQAVAKWLAEKPRSQQDRYTIAALQINPQALLPLSDEDVEERIAGAPASFNRYLSLVVAIHNCSRVDPPEIERKKAPKGRTRWLTQEEWIRLRKALDEVCPMLGQAAEFTLETGLRENNVLGLQWGQVDLRRRVAWLYADQTKGGEPLGVALNERACAILEARRAVHRQWVFGNPDQPLTRASNRAWYTARRKARLKGFRWHDLRHTWASWHVMNGTRLEELQELGGWKTLQMVRRYAHLSPEHLHAVASNVKPVSLRYNRRKAGGKGTKSPTVGA